MDGIVIPFSFFNDQRKRLEAASTLLVSFTCFRRTILLQTLQNAAPASRAFRPERVVPVLSPFEEIVCGGVAAMIRPLRIRRTTWARFVRQVVAFEPEFRDLSEQGLSAKIMTIVQELRREKLDIPLVSRSFALIRETSFRVLGMRHYESQIRGGWYILNGLIAEMETGEGKTLTATLAAATAALAGIPVHVITVNDYLAERDAKEMGPLYRAMGLSVGCVMHGMDSAGRRAAYDCDITYVTNKEIAFDYLRDSTALGSCRGTLELHKEYLAPGSSRLNNLVLRGLHFAIVDEADSVLIDEARTPLILSRKTDDPGMYGMYRQALDMAECLEKNEDFILSTQEHTLRLTPGGQEKIANVSKKFGGLWKTRLRREETIRQALTALHLYHLNEHYVIHEGKVAIVDEFTGRLMPDRSWEHGLHQMIEIKEGCPPSSRNETVIRTSYQVFFRRYLHLAGMTGTAHEVRRELWSVYRLGVAKVPTNKPLRRIRQQGKIFPCADLKWEEVARCVRVEHEKGRPVLLGTRTVAASERAGEILSRHGLEHTILNARQDSLEADIVARAGEVGRITIATNMAGRGTDIRLMQGVPELGGLMVILTERHESGRIDRQLAGRCGRQGDPGSFLEILSLDDALLHDARCPVFRWVIRHFFPQGKKVTWWVDQVLGILQHRVEKQHRLVRSQLMKQDKDKKDALAFAGYKNENA